MYYTDRRYVRNNNDRNDRGTSRFQCFPRYPQNRNTRYPQDQNPRFRNPRDSRVKRCFVCKKQGCWSTKHSKEEQEDQKEKYRREYGRTFDRNAAQWITEYEGTEDDDDLDDFQTFVLNLEEDTEHAEHFMLSTVEKLSNLATQHALTGIVPDKSNFPFAYSTTSEETSRYNSDKWYGIMIDTGAARASTAGFGQYLAYKETVDSTATLDTSDAGAIKVKFGIGSTSSVGSLKVQSPVGEIVFHVVRADTPFLMSLRDVDSLGCYYNNLTDKVVTPTSTVPVARQFGHPFLLWGKTLQQFVTASITSTTCYLTVIELSRLHRRFGHPSVGKLHALLERSGHDINKEMIEKLTKYCRHCQKHSKSPYRFKFKLPDNLDFNHTVFVDIFYIDGKPVLHVVDEATGFTVARFLKDISIKTT